MIFTNSFSRDLGVFTWSALQTAYPNSGGALAALPTGTRAFVSDWGALFTPNAAKTAWIPVSVITMFSSSANSASALNTAATFIENFTVTVPNDLLVPGNFILAYLRTSRTAGTATYRPQINVGATRLSLASGSSLGSKYFGAAQLMCRTANQLSGADDGGPSMGFNSYTSIALVAATVNGANPLRFGVCEFSTSDSSTTVVYEHCSVQMMQGT